MRWKKKRVGRTVRGEQNKKKKKSTGERGAHLLAAAAPAAMHLMKSSLSFPAVST